VAVRLAEIPLIERVLIALKKEQKEFADSAMRSPAHRDAFEYGRVTGHYSGLMKAVETIEMALNVESEDDDHGYNRRGETSFIIRD
jgi:hypothetical protein